MTRFFAAALGAVLFAISGAAADDTAPLTTDQASRFIETLEPVQALGEELKTDGKAEALAVEMRPKANETFKPYSSAVAVMKEKFPAEHARLGALVSNNGFTADSWASAGDRVMIAYLAEKMERENPEAMTQMEQMDPAMLEMMPANMKEQMAAAMAMMTAVKNAPAADRAAIEPVIGDLDAFMETQAAAHAAPPVEPAQ